VDKNFIILICQHFQILESCSYTCHPLWHNKMLCLQSLSKWMWNHWYMFFFKVQLNVKTQHCESTIVALLQNQRNCSQFVSLLLNVTYKVCHFMRGWFLGLSLSDSFFQEIILTANTQHSRHYRSLVWNVTTHSHSSPQAPSNVQKLVVNHPWTSISKRVVSWKFMLLSN